MTHYYVYYRVEPEALAELAEAVRELFASVRSATGVQGRWLHRRDDPTTYMEVYDDVGDAARFEALLEREVTRCRFARFLASGGARMTECFVTPRV